MIKNILKLLVLLVLAGLVLTFAFLLGNLKGIKPVLTKPPEDISKILSTIDAPLELPPGFSISIFSKDLPSARVMLIDSLGNMWVSQTKEGKVTLLEVEDGRVVRQNAIFNNLKRPHGLALDPQDPFLLYIAEEDKISRVRIYSEGNLMKVANLPAGGRHFTRTIRFGLDGRLYVSIGSSCDTCNEEDPRFASIYSMDRDGSDFKEYARGLRNAVFFTLNPTDGKWWATEMGRDFLGDDLPPDEIDVVLEGKNYGWPDCYGKNILDTKYHKDNHVHIRAHCQEPFEIPSFIDIPAHSAPLGLAFMDDSWGQEYKDDLFVAYHGSWNRTVPTGYKVVRMKLDKQGSYQGTEDFITGWLTEDNKAFGRPVDITVQSGGVMYISDDKAGVIYKVIYNAAIQQGERNK